MPDFLNTLPPDTVATQAPQLLIEPTEQAIGKLEITRQTIELSSLDRVIDTVRIAQAPKKAIPIIKTIPFVPENDTVPSPVYNTFTQKFDLPKAQKGWDLFNFTPFRPEDAIAINKPKIEAVPTQTVTIHKINPDEVFTAEKDNQKQGFLKTDWMLGVIIIAYLIFGWVNVKFSRFISSVVVASYNYFASRRLQEEGNIMRNKVFNTLNVLFFINSALLITQWFSYNHFSILNQNSILLFLIFLMLIVILYSLKALFLVILDFFFLTKGLFISYNINVFIYNKLFGIILLPLVTIIPFAPQKFTIPLFILAAIFFGLLYFMRILRGIQIGIKNGLSILYLILYLCALEIFPVLIIYHVISKYV